MPLSIATSPIVGTPNDDVINGKRQSDVISGKGGDDLARGREPGYADGERRAMSIENYRRGETAPLRNDVATQDTFDAGGGFRSNAPTGSGSN